MSPFEEFRQLTMGNGPFAMRFRIGEFAVNLIIKNLFPALKILQFKNLVTLAMHGSAGRINLPDKLEGSGQRIVGRLMVYCDEVQWSENIMIQKDSDYDEFLRGRQGRLEEVAI